MSSKLNVKQNAGGQWDILREGDRRAALTADTEHAAVLRAREQLLEDGGGEVRIIDRTGKIASSTAVKARGRDSTTSGARG